MDTDKKAYLAITEESGGEDGEFFYEISHTFGAEDDPGKILIALKALGLSWELKKGSTRIIEVSREWGGKELLELAHMKINNKYELVPEDTPEEEIPEIDIFDPKGPKMSVSVSSDRKNEEGVE